MLDAGWSAFISIITAIISAIAAGYGVYRKMKKDHDKKISEESAHITQTNADISYIRQSVDDIKEAQKETQKALSQIGNESARQDERITNLEKGLDNLRREVADLRASK